MTNATNPSDRLSTLSLRSRFSASARQRRRRCDRRLQVAAEILLLEDRCLMSTIAVRTNARGKAGRPAGEPKIEIPGKHINPDLPELFVGNAQQPKPPAKLITIYNNSANTTIYPILEDANNVPSNSPTTSLYDPYDNITQEYRGYIGYADGKKDYLGLPAGKSITIEVPLVFWNGGTLQLATTDPLQDNDIWTYRKGSTQYTTPSSTETPNGRVMWYHSKNAAGLAENINESAPTQLAEWSIRDKYLGTMTTGSQIAASEKPANPFVNYDVSYVDNLMLPVAFEAPSTSPPNHFNLSMANGWLGSNLQIGTMQDTVKAFTSTTPGTNNALLGTYFGGRGYDQYFNPNAATQGRKIPAGYNAFANSALTDTESSDPTVPKRFSLVSGGEVARVETASSGKVQEGLNTITDIKPGVVKKLTEGMLSLDPAYFARGTTITNVDRVNNSITLSTPALHDGAANYGYTFIGSQYSKVSGKVDGEQLSGLNPNIVVNLTPGMLVNGPGITKPGTKILSIATDDKSVTLTQSAGKDKGDYDFVSGPSDYVASPR